MVGWLQGRNMMAPGMVEEDCSTHGSQEAEEEKQGQKQDSIQTITP